MKATVVITSKNRKHELSKAIDSVLKQDYPYLSILVFDDGSTDGTTSFIKNKYENQKVTVYRESQSLGLIDARNKAATLVEKDIIFSIDDDAIFSNKTIISDCIKLFANYKQIGAIAIPLIDVLYNNRKRQYPIDKEQVYVTSDFIGTAHALRKDVFLSLGGYKNGFVRQEEEPEFCIRLLNSGYYVAIADTSPILHFEYPKENLDEVYYYWARNTLLSQFINTPTLFLPVQIIISFVLMLKNEKNKNYLNNNSYKGNIISGFLDGIRLFSKYKHKPVKLKTYFKYRRLRKKQYPINKVL